jgi:hypothetical protein
MVADGFERNGRISYTDGLDTAMSVFREIQTAAPKDLQLLILAELTFLTQELAHCDETDTLSAASLNQAIGSFKDALFALQAVEKGALYQIADMTYPHDAKHRYKDMPRDAFHTACLSHRTRIDNTLRVYGVNLTEKELLKQRKVNLAAAQNVYLSKQRDAISQRGEP